MRSLPDSGIDDMHGVDVLQDFNPAFFEPDSQENEADGDRVWLDATASCSMRPSWTRSKFATPRAASRRSCSFVRGGTHLTNRFGFADERQTKNRRTPGSAVFTVEPRSASTYGGIDETSHTRPEDLCRSTTGCRRAHRRSNAADLSRPMILVASPTIDGSPSNTMSGPLLARYTR